MTDRLETLARFWLDEGPHIICYKTGRVDALDALALFAPAPVKQYPCAQVPLRPAFTSERPLTKRQRRRNRGRKQP